MAAEMISLEQRTLMSGQVLSASANELTLGDFTGANQSVTVTKSGSSVRFQLGSGTWSNVPTGVGLSLDNGETQLVANAKLYNGKITFADSNQVSLDVNLNNVDLSSMFCGLEFVGVDRVTSNQTVKLSSLEGGYQRFVVNGDLELGTFQTDTAGFEVGLNDTLTSLDPNPEFRFDLDLVASDLHPTFRIFGSPSPDAAPFTKLRLGTGVTTLVRDLSLAAQAAARLEDITIEFGSEAVPALTLSTFDNGVVDGVANQNYTADPGDNPALRILLDGVVVAQATVERIELETRIIAGEVVTRIARGVFHLDSAGADSRIFDDLLAATNGTGDIEVGSEYFPFEGTDIGVGDAQLFEIPAFSRLQRSRVDDLFFAATEGGQKELYLSDGTPAGTARVKNLNGASSGAPQNMLWVDHTLFFSAVDGGQRELWKSDGTAAGTVLVRNLNGTQASNPAEITLGGCYVYFVGTHNGQRELWRTDGTTAGTAMVRNLNGSASSSPKDLVWADGVLYFTAVSGGQRELWKTDGTSGGTTLVRDLNGASSSTPTELTWAEGTLYFSAINSGQRELWKTDGTSIGTKIVKNLNGTGNSTPHELTWANDQLFFVATHNGQTELWHSNGTAAGTLIANDLGGAASSNPRDLTWGAGYLVYAATVSGETELYLTEGATLDSGIVRDLNGGNSGNPQEITFGDGVFYFTAVNSGQRELWSSTNVGLGTKLVKNLNGANGSNPASLTWANGRLFFAATHSSQRELWVSRGTAATTVQADNLNGASSSNPAQLTPNQVHPPLHHDAPPFSGPVPSTTPLRPELSHAANDDAAAPSTWREWLLRRVRTSG